MRVLLLANMRSGMGKAPKLREALERDLLARGHEVILRDVGELLNGHAPETNGTRSPIGGADVVVSIGGDGTIYHALVDLIEAQCPLYHAPGGNENLFAREFGMASDPPALVRALEGGRVDAVDVGTVNGHPFAVMVSVGPDAGVIQRLSVRRGRATGHAMYILPVFRESLRPHLPRLSVFVDGEPVVRGRKGLVVAANSRHYALRLNLAQRADVRDGLLDVVFLPAGSTARALWWGVRCKMGGPAFNGHAVYSRGSDVRIESADLAPWQADGEAGGWVQPGGRLEIGVRPAALRVLCP